MENYHSNERRRFAPASANLPLRDRILSPRPPETILSEEKVTIERKTFRVSRRENARGQFFVISEERAPSPTDDPLRPPRSNRIIIPSVGIENLIQAMKKISTKPNEK